MGFTAFNPTYRMKLYPLKGGDGYDTIAVFEGGQTNTQNTSKPTRAEGHVLHKITNGDDDRHDIP
ncbi:MAG: hypothetical protein OXT74_16095 [Candidatus Poribacteria bacterium]|nr:hypothetical protein [Candidatus Poribacteria bacterium]